MSTAPTACAVVPSGMGTLNIMMRNATAANTASVGTLRTLTVFWTFFEATAIIGTATAYPAMQVAGLR